MKKSCDHFKALGSDGKYYTIAVFSDCDVNPDCDPSKNLKHYETSDGVPVIHVRDDVDYSIPSTHISLKRQR